MSAPHEPRLGVDISVTSDAGASEFTQPNNKHVSSQTLADLTYEKICVGESHAGADN